MPDTDTKGPIVFIFYALKHILIYSNNHSFWSELFIHTFKQFLLPTYYTWLSQCLYTTGQKF